MPIDAVDLSEHLRALDFHEPRAALAFGDVLAAGNRRRGVRRWFYRGVNMLATMIPGAIRDPEMAHTVVLVAADHDARSVDRMNALLAAIDAAGIDVCLWKIGSAQRIVGIGLKGVLQSPAISPREVSRAVGAVRGGKRRKVRFGDQVEILRWVLVQTARTKSFANILRGSKTSLIISDFDRGLAGAPVILAARQQGIPTLTLLHGDPNRVGYTPFLAKSVSTWSARQREALSRWDPAATLLEPVGAHWIRPPRILTSRTEPLRRVLFAHSGDGGFIEFARDMSALAKECQKSGSDVRFRPHPLTRVEERRIVEREWEVSATSSWEDLQWADLVYCEQSTFAFEAVLSGCIVRIRGGEGLASIEGLRPEDVTVLSNGWVELPSPTSDWPYRYTGETALAALVKQVEGCLSSTSGPGSRTS